MKFLASTFSPAMLGPGARARVAELPPEDGLAEIISRPDIVSIVGHDVTCMILSALVGREVKFNRASVMLAPGDEVWCLIPNFRAKEAREFSRDEVEGAGFRAFKVEVF